MTHDDATPRDGAEPDAGGPRWSAVRGPGPEGAYPPAPAPAGGSAFPGGGRQPDGAAADVHRPWSPVQPGPGTGTGTGHGWFSADEPARSAAPRERPRRGVGAGTVALLVLASLLLGVVVGALGARQLFLDEGPALSRSPLPTSG
ncbi:hypothetical protein PU560_00990, partial [Georgenia sp. 10Sc9-8]|nr:hypothetical protein [Georgenia halotolerans]